MHDAEVEVEALAQLFGEPLRLGEQVLGVEQDDLDAGHRGGGDVDEHGVFEAGGDDQLVGAEVLGGPAGDVGGVARRRGSGGW